MILNITGRHFEIADKIRAFIDQKAQKLSKYSSKIVEVKVIIEPNIHIYDVEAIVTAKHIDIYGHGEADDVYSSIDLALKKVERQLSQIKDKVKNKHAAMKSKKAAVEQVSSEEEEPEQEEDVQE